MAAIGESVLPEKEIVHHGHLVPESQEGWSQHRSNIARTACDQNLHN